MPREHEQELRDLKDHARRVLDLFPWPDDSLSGEGGIGQRLVLTDLRTPQQVATEDELRDLRAALNSLVGGIAKYLREPPEG
jgi:hypothetical protein